MARRSRGVVTTAAKAVAYPFAVRSKFEAFIRPAARAAGALGIAMLVGCGVLWRTPAQDWPHALAPARLPVYAMISLAVASLLGWTFVHDGQKRIAKFAGRTVSLVAFVILPIAFAYLGWIGAARVAALGGPQPSHWIWILVRWYGPTLVVASLAVFLTWKSRGRYDRGAWFALLVAPYVALLAYLVFGFRVAAIDDAHHVSMTTLGTWALALHLALAFFVGGNG